PTSEDRLFASPSVTACLETSGDVPTEKFDAKLIWNDPALIDFIEPTLNLGLTAMASESTPTVFVDKEKPVGVRPIDKDLNIAGSIISSVEDKEQEDKTILRQRTTRATLDLRIGLFRNTEQLTVRNLGGAKLPPSKICGRVDDYTPPTSTTSGSISINENKFGLAS